MQQTSCVDQSPRAKAFLEVPSGHRASKSAAYDHRALLTPPPVHKAFRRVTSPASQCALDFDESGSTVAPSPGPFSSPTPPATPWTSATTPLQFGPSDLSTKFAQFAGFEAFGSAPLTAFCLGEPPVTSQAAAPKETGVSTEAEDAAWVQRMGQFWDPEAHHMMQMFGAVQQTANPNPFGEALGNAWLGAALGAAPTRKLEASLSEATTTPPITPRASERCAPSTPGTPFKSRVPPMMQALLSDSMEEVQAVLHADRDSAWEPFWDHEIEPPLCFATRRLCDPKIVELLLNSGADADITDKDGRTALALVRSAIQPTLSSWDTVPCNLPFELPVVPRAESGEAARRKTEIMRLLAGEAGVDEASEKAAENAFETPPTTPRRAPVRRSCPSSPCKPPMTPMMEALFADSLAEVQAALDLDRDAAWEPFWDHNVEPPLCFAARNLCDPRIVNLLLTARANASDVDKDDQTPLELARSAVLPTLAPWDSAAVACDLPFEVPFLPRADPQEASKRKEELCHLLAASSMADEV